MRVFGLSSLGAVKYRERRRLTQVVFPNRSDTHVGQVEGMVLHGAVGGGIFRV